MNPQKTATCTDIRGSMEKTRRQLQSTMLEMKTILAPVVILVSQGPQQQGEVRTRHHMAASSQVRLPSLFSFYQVRLI